MTDKSHERDLWIPYLHHVWPKGSKRAEVAAKLSAINKVRNRAAHHEHLFNPVHKDTSPSLAGTYMAELYAHLVPQAFRDAFPTLQPIEMQSFIDESVAPVEVSLQ